MSKAPAALPAPTSDTPPPARAPRRPFAPRLESSTPIEPGDFAGAVAEIAKRRRSRAAPPEPGPDTRPAVDPATELGVRPFSPLSSLPPPAVAGAAPAPLPASPPAAAPAATPPAIGPETSIAVTIDGKVEYLPLAELQRGYMRQRDYSAKTAQVADQMRQATEMHGAFNKAREALEARLPEVLAGYEDEFGKGPIDWVQLAATDPIGYAQKDARHKAYLAARQEAEHLAQLRQREEETRKLEMRRLGHEFLAQVLPGWSDATVRQHLQGLHVRYLSEVGYSPEEIEKAELLDPRQIVIVEEARRFRLLAAAHPELLREQVMTPVNPQAAGVSPRAIAGNGLLSSREPASAEVNAQEAWEQAKAAGGRVGRDAAVALIAARRAGRTRLQ